MISPALQALYRGEPEQARALLGPEDELPAYEAAAFGRLERLERLIDDDPANANDRSPDGFTALHLAIFGESAGAVRLLVDRGADLEAVSSAEIAQVTPLGTAAFLRSTALARVLLEAGADPATGLATARANEDEAFEALLAEFGAS
jgi:ankyrin repeat protein